MTDESNQGAPRGPLFVALDLYDRIPRIRTACAALGVPLASVDLKDSGRAQVGFGTTEGPHGEHDHRGHASIEANAYQVRLSIEAIYRRDKPAPLGAAVAQLRASVAALDILLEPPGEVVDAEFIEVPDAKRMQRALAKWSLWAIGDPPALDGMEPDAIARAAESAMHLAETAMPARQRTVAATSDGKDDRWVQHSVSADFELDGTALHLSIRQNGPRDERINVPAVLRRFADHIAGERDRAETTETTDAGSAADFERLATARGDKLVAVAEALFGEPAADSNVDDIPVERFAEGIGKLRGALQATRAGRDEAWNALAGLAGRVGVVFDSREGGESAAEIADLIHDFTAEEKKGLRNLVTNQAAKLRRNQEEITGLHERLARIRKTLELDDDYESDAVMERLGLLKSLADAVMAELEMVDLDGVEQMAVACLSGGRDNRRQYLELVAAIGCGTSTAHETAVRKAAQLQHEHDDALAERKAIAEAAGESGACLASHVCALRAEIDATTARIGDMRKAIGLDADASPTETAQRLVEIVGNAKAAGAEFTALQKLRMALFLPASAGPAEIIETALARIEQAGAPCDLLTKMRTATEKLEAAAAPPSGAVVWLDPDHVAVLRRLVDRMDLRLHVLEAAAMAAGLDGERRGRAARAVRMLLCGTAKRTPWPAGTRVVRVEKPGQGEGTVAHDDGGAFVDVHWDGTHGPSPVFAEAVRQIRVG